MLAPISLWPPGGQYCLTVTALWGVGNTYGGALCIPSQLPSQHVLGDGIPPQRSETQDRARLAIQCGFPIVLLVLLGLLWFFLVF